ncbi:hypothetical protein [Seonamhaeicola sp.]|uniref:hypothetical protein n=1 Tax=Seonamhaeicola sp. TaxID=1912245 RepID=UPI003564115C
MHKLKQHIAFKLVVLSIVATFLAPSIIKFAHIFEHHKHVVCKGGNSTHFHQVDFECEFFKFQLNTHFIIPDEFNECLNISHQYQVPIATYKFLNKYQPLSLSLRGPPVIV